MKDLLVGMVAGAVTGVVAIVVAIEVYRRHRTAGHDPFCLVMRYPLTRQDAEGFPWCTCSWRGRVANER